MTLPSWNKYITKNKESTTSAYNVPRAHRLFCMKPFVTNEEPRGNLRGMDHTFQSGKTTGKKLFAFFRDRSIIEKRNFGHVISEIQFQKCNFRHVNSGYRRGL
jgi:hypothetical protein